MSILYSLRTDGDQFRITKFIDGDVESSYLSTQYECQCPAGHRPSCRHRQMIPDMLAHGILDTHWFYNFDIRRVVDFNGMLKSNFDAMNELAGWDNIKPEEIGKPVRINLPAEVVSEAPPSNLCVDEGCPQAGVEHVCITTEAAGPPSERIVKPWRRL